MSVSEPAGTLLELAVLHALLDPLTAAGRARTDQVEGLRIRAAASLAAMGVPAPG